MHDPIRYTKSIFYSKRGYIKAFKNEKTDQSYRIWPNSEFCSKNETTQLDALHTSKSKMMVYWTNDCRLDITISGSASAKQKVLLVKRVMKSSKVLSPAN